MKEQTIQIKGDRLAIFDDAVLVNEQNGHLGVSSTELFDAAAQDRSAIARYIISLRNRFKVLVPPIANRQTDRQADPLPAGDNSMTDL